MRPLLQRSGISCRFVSMDTVYITGHRNPDMDSVCAAWAYADLKKKTDTSAEYIPIRCGAMNPQTKSVFSKLGISPPKLVKDIRPRVSDVARRDIARLYSKDPVYTAIEELDKKTLSMIPVFDADNEYAGTISIHEISSFLMNENLETRPRYNFSTRNIPKVVPGYFYSTGSGNFFNAPLMIGAMPYEISIERIGKLGEDLPLLVVGLREELIEYAVKHNFPGIILTGLERDKNIPVDFSGYAGCVYVSQVDTAETVRLLRLSAPIEDIMNRDTPRVSVDTEFEEAKNMLIGSGYRGLPVFEGNRFSGVVTRRCFIEKPKPNLILVDHNEIEQSVVGADGATIKEIIDHHRLSLPQTREPIRVEVQPLGSTCTILHGLFLAHGVKPSKEASAVLLSGILSDTVMLKSPTATDADTRAIEALAEIAGVDWQEWGTDMFRHSATLKGTGIENIVGGDFKIYEQSGKRVGIGQVEVIGFEEVPELKGELLEYMGGEAGRKGLDWVLLLITDVLKQDSVLLATEPNGFKPRLIYTKTADGEYSLPGILSRKKQLLPEVFRVIEETE